MKYAIFSDIHANLEALERAVSFAESRKTDEWIVLGDTIGYGANPNECFEWAMNHASVNLLGNHEKAAVDPALREWFNVWAREAIEWTEGVLNSKFKKVIRELPNLRIEAQMTFAHASVHEPEAFHYLFNYKDAAPSFKLMKSKICFVGHTHIPGCICESKKSAEYLAPGVIKLQKKERYILNPGSVGQPRDQDPRLAFGIYDSEKMTFEIVRLNYDNDKAAAKIRRAGLPSYLADRLL